MPEYNITELTKFANLLADSSGVVIKKYYRNFGEIVAKGDSSPVTIADREAESAIKRLINHHYPAHGVQGEEFGVENDGAEFKWVIDPIDGTASFMIGRPIFGTLIALLHNGEPLIGIIDQPITGERWVGAKGGKTLFNGKEVGVRACGNLSDAVLCTTGPQYFNAEKLQNFNAIAGVAKYSVYGGDCYNYALLAMGKVDVVVESGLKPHDFIALKVVVEQAGGIATDWSGKPLDMESNGDVVFCCDKRVHAEILRMLK